MNFPYSYKRKRSKVGLYPIHYKVGQGIGLYTSWAILAITNHVIVKIAAERVGLHGFEDYLVLGDDVIIANRIVSQEYKLIMTSLGVDISISKRVVPGPHSSDGGEFASRLVKGDWDYSPLPVGLLLRNDTHNKLRFVMEVIRRYEASLEPLRQGEASMRGLEVDTIINLTFRGKKMKIGDACELFSFYFPLVK
jgi:hypothetical protein